MTMESIDNSKVENKLKFWSEQLQDLSGRNRLLFFKDTKTSTATIKSPGFAELFQVLVEKGGELIAPIPDTKGSKGFFDDGKEDSSDLKERLLPARKLRDNELDTNHTVSVLNKVLYNLRYTSRTVQEEQGFNILFMTFGMLRWKESQDSDYSFAPLILVPVLLNRESPLSPYKISMAEDDIVVNPVLQTKLLKDFGIQLTEISNDISSEELQAYLKNVSNSVHYFEGWEVEEKAAIGAFNFLTLLLIKDFDNYSTLYINHTIVQSLSGISIQLPIPNNLPEAKDLDDVVDPSTVFQIMDADSSQQEAIEAAKRGLSFILQGPPGTGKSQTIANIIAEFLMGGKKVLFVSQKMAALEVVKKRLEQKGIGEFCLEAHSHKMDKHKVVNELMWSLSNIALPNRQTDYQLQHEQLKQLVKELNTYIRQLHEPKLEIKLSSYQAQGRLAQYFDAPELSFDIPDIEKLSPISVDKMISLVREISTFDHIITTHDHNRWKGFKETESSTLERENIELSLGGTADSIRDLHDSVSNLILAFNLPIPETIQSSLDYLYVFANFQPGIFSGEMISAINNFLGRYHSITRIFSAQYWRDSSLLKSVSIKQRRPVPADVVSVLKVVRRIEEEKPFDPEINPPDYTQPIIDLVPLQALVVRIFDGFKLAIKMFDKDNIPECLTKKANQRPEEAIEWFLDHSQNVGELDDWAKFNAVVKESKNVGLGDFLTKALEKKLPPSNWVDSFNRRLYLLLSEKLIADRPLLYKFRGLAHSEIIDRFRTIDLAVIKNASREIKAKLYLNKPQATWLQAGSAETSILRREYNKKRRLMPLRKLFHEIPNLIQTLKPCLMMSPLTVCQLLDPKVFQFDLVVFDEASQIPPEYAISAFLRARQVIVAGDRNQLPPTNFFRTIEADETDDEDNEEMDDLFESILNACDGSGFPIKTLNWHYRSRDESLIAFSNHHFYDNRLYTFPNSNIEGVDTGLEFIFVKDGVYKRGSGARHNLREAHKVAELVRMHFIKSPELSLGIVAFSLSQRKAIEEQIDKMRTENPELNALFVNEQDEPVFIKNLENVQGDERDVIILSVGYGKDETGKMTMNFGPINRSGGARRLNVAVTRARFALKLVTSIEPEDIDLTRTEAHGAALLRNYLEVARDGVKAVFKDDKISADAEFESPFEESVYKTLTNRGVHLVPQVGVSQYRIDLAVIEPDQPGRFILGIECDGAMYHSALTARDRDRLRQQILEGLGWKVHRIWSREWVQNREGEIKKVLDAIESSKKRILMGDSPTKKKLSDSLETNRQSLNLFDTNGSTQTINDQLKNSPNGSIPYLKRKLQRQHPTGGNSLLNTSISRVISAFKAIVDAEGPISVDVAKYRVLEAWAARKGSRINSFLDSVINQARYQKILVQRGKFLWPIGMQVPPFRIHIQSQEIRSIEEIPPEEITIAVLECVKCAVGILSEDLIRETCRLFGLNVTRENAIFIQNIVNGLVNNKLLTSEDDKIIMGK